MNKILAFSGSSSSKSINQKLVRMAAGLLEPSAVTVIDIRAFPLPIYSIDIEEGDGIPENAHKLKALFSTHDGFLISCPENNGSVPVIFKNVVDWLSRMGGKIFQNKPVLLLSTSPGARGGKTNLANIETLMAWWGGTVVATLSIGSFHDAIDAENLLFKSQPVHDDVRAAVGALERELAAPAENG